MSRKKRSRDTSQEESPESETPPQDAVSLYAQKVKEIAGTFAGITGVAYALGFLITNIHLNTKYGIYDFALVKARYIYSGFTFLLLCLMAAIGSLLLLQTLTIESRSLRSRVVKIVSLLFTWLMASSISSLSLKGLLALVEGNRLEAMQEFPITLWFRLAIPMFAFQIWSIRKGGLKRFNVPMPISSSVFTSIVFLAAFYGLSYYQLLPFSLGGGMPIPIRMVVDEGKVDLVQQLIPIERESTTETVYLVEQSDNAYFVLVNSVGPASLVRPVEVGKSLVVGIIHPFDIPLPPITQDRILGPGTNVTSTPPVTKAVDLTATVVLTP